MKRRVVLSLAIIGFLLALVYARAKEDAMDGKFVIILQAGTESHEGLARALHALLYAQELKSGGYSVTLIFDGAGTAWAEAFQKPDHMLHGKYAALKEQGVVEEICDHCAGAFKVKESIKKMDEKSLVGEFEGHPSLKKWVDQGYQIVVL